MSGNPEPYFSFLFEGNIWRMLVDDATGLLALEIRDPEARETYFASVDLEQGHTHTFLPETEEEWWLGLEDVYRDRIFLHYYKEEGQSPEHQGVVCVSKTGSLLWQQNDFRYVQHGAEHVLVLDDRQDQRRYLKLDPGTGKPLQEEAGAPVPERGHHTLQHPNHYTAESGYFNTVVDFLEDETGYRPVKAADYMETKGYVVISYYIYEGEELANYLLLMSEEAEVYLHERIGHQLPGIGLDTFLVYKNLLLFIQDKKELKSYAL